MNVGDYVRTKDGRIGKIIDINLGDFQTRYELDNSDGFHYEYRNDIIKSSPNIIDLIEVGDYVNGEKVTSIQDNWLGFGNYDYYRQEYEIKSIVTREMFESMEYKVGE